MINVTVKTKCVIYEFSIQDKYTIVGGDSATRNNNLQSKEKVICRQ